MATGAGKADIVFGLRTLEYTYPKIREALIRLREISADDADFIFVMQTEKDLAPADDEYLYSVINFLVNMCHTVFTIPRQLETYNAHAHHFQ